MLRVSPATQDRSEELKTPVTSERRTTFEIPVSQFARIRSLVKYGMSAAQVAESYGVAAGAIKRILRKT